MDKLEAINRLSRETAKEIQKAVAASNNEAEFRRKFSNILEDIARRLGVDLFLREEYTLATGRADAAYNRLIIEYERPGSLRSSSSHGHTKHAIQQVKDYMEGVAKEERQEISRLAGVALDGCYYVFVRCFDGNWKEEEPVPVNEHTTARFLRLLFSLVSGKALIPENLIKDFGSQNLPAQNVTLALYNALLTNKNALVQKVFEQWQTFFGEVTGYEEGTARLKDKPELKKFARGLGVDPSKAEPPLLFFAVHTYFALLIKLIAYLALSRFVSGFGTAFGELASLESEDLRKKMDELERGGLYRHLGIRNFLEGDFFKWYLWVWNPKVEEMVRYLLEKLNDYDPGTLEVSPEQTRDLLKKLYHYLMPKELRHDLGEYYTPDWLAQRVLNQIEGGQFIGDPKKRLIDPACGSGTFLILAIKAMKENCLKNLGYNERDTLNAILRSIVGIDLNPLAMIAARTNYILALGDLLAHRRHEIQIPVYMADSILTPAEGEGLFGKDKYPLKTTVGIFEIPSIIKSKDQIETLADLLNECVESQTSAKAFLSRCKAKLSLNDDQWTTAEDLLRALYKTISDLHSQGLNGIWAQIIKNAFMPIFLDDFDYVVGNPPWVNWESLPTGYRDDTKKLWVYHGLFPHGGMDTILGKGKKDISMLMTYEAAEAFLKQGGKLAFVITQSVFKTAGAGQGFRKFTLARLS